MSMLRRCTLGVLVLAVLLTAATARAQVLKQVPAKAFVVIKINNLQGVSEKVGAFAQKLGLANFEPAFGDPLGALKKEFNIKEGLDGKGEAAVALYMPAAEGDEPRFFVLLPVTDYKAFVANLQDVKQEGDLTTFKMPDEQQPIYIANVGTYAAMTPFKDLIAQAEKGIEVGGAPGKQLATNDVTVYADMKIISAVALPQLKGAREAILNEVQQGLGNEPGFNPKFVPAVKALVSQILNVAEGTLQDCQAATLGFNITAEGISATLVGDFAPDSYAGKMFAKVKNTDANLLAGLPDRKYFVYGGMVNDPALAAQVIDDFTAPIAKELAAAGDDGKPFLSLIDSMKLSMSAIESGAFAYAQPTAAPGQQSVIQEVVVYRGDAEKLAAATKQAISGVSDLMKLLPKEAGITTAVESKPAAKKVDDATLDQMSFQFKVDPNNPAAPQIEQMMKMMYGGMGLISYMGPVGPRTFVAIVGGDDELITSVVAAAKKETAFGQAANIQAVAKQLPKERTMVCYVAIDNIIGTVMQYMDQMGMGMKMKLPPDLPPLGIETGTEGPAFRLDVHFPATLIEQLVSFGMQAAMRMQGGGQPGGL